MNDIIEAFNTIADALDRHADQLLDQQAGGRPDKVLVRESAAAIRYIAAVTRGDNPPGRVPELGPPIGAVRHGPGCRCPYCPPADEPVTT
jgi:hypothetical protein